ncbi:hypothetical protein BTA51_25615 [Hahella sp. CCB-MM4]|nr:hypothetical protein BTA51_25615 [Hahella sp. CCB-MM4]
MWLSLFDSARSYPLSAKTAVRVLGFSIVIAIASTVFLTWSEYQREMDELLTGLDNTVSAIQPGLVHSIWSIDTTAIEGTLEGILKHPSIYNATLVTSIDTTFTLGSPPQGEPSISRTYPMHQETKPELWLGDLTVLVSLESLHQDTLIYFGRTLVLQLIKILLIAVFLLLMIRYLIMRHLEKICRHSTHSMKSSDPEELVLDRQEPPLADELSKIVKFINGLQGRVRTQASELHESEKQSHLERVEALQASHNKSLFIANISHELRTPMNNILGYSGLLQDTAQTDEQREYISAVQQSSESLLAMLNDMLDLSKLESGALESDSCPTELKSLLQETIASLSGKADAKSLTIESYVDAAIPKKVILDRVNLLRILECLLSVAISLTIKGQVVLHVVPVSSSGGTLTLRMAVEDNGAGLSAEDKRRILANTFEAATAESLPEVGIGLKLALAREMIELLGGRFGIESEVGKGSTFWFETEAGLLSGEDLSTSSEDSALQIGHLLLADTNELSLRAIIEQLGEEDRLQIDVAKNIRDVEQLLDQVRDTGQPYDAFILDETIADSEDVAIDQMTALIRDIRQQEEHKGVPILVLSPHPKVETITKYHQSGASAYLSKVDRELVVRDVLYDQVTGRRSNAAMVLSPSLARSLEQTRPSHGELYVLLVEDNEVNRNLARKMLEKCGCRVEMAENGEVALQQLGTGNFDMVFMDCWMPVLDGYDTTRRIRASNEPYRNIPIVALTANAFAGEKQKCFEAGMNEFLTKPIRYEELAGIVRRFKEGALSEYV